jgi:hypothetical protein
MSAVADACHGNLYQSPILRVLQIAVGEGMRHQYKRDAGLSGRHCVGLMNSNGDMSRRRIFP